MATLRRFIAAILFLGMAGALTELFLLGHTEDFDQWIPIGLLLVALVLLVWNTMRPTVASLRLWQAVMVLFFIAGLTGSWLHFGANLEFQLEMDPSLSGAALFWKAAQAKSPPALAPGVMVQMGLLGLAYTFRHPYLRKPEVVEADR